MKINPQPFLTLDFIALLLTSLILPFPSPSLFSLVTRKYFGWLSYVTLLPSLRGSFE